jgi:hypothetical protein
MSPGERSPATTSSFMGDPAHRTVIKPALFTPPATVGISPDNAEDPAPQI